jgi:signal peptidase II
MAATAAVVLALDLGSKAWASARLDEPVEIIGSLSLQLAHNPGVAFGLGSSLPTWVLLAFSAAMCAATAAAGARSLLVPPAAVGLILGGALGNLLDRLTAGSVVDMIHLTWWPTFNLADVAICTGAAATVIYALIPQRAPDASDTTALEAQ